MKMERGIIKRKHQAPRAFSCPTTRLEKGNEGLVVFPFMTYMANLSRQDAL